MKRARRNDPTASQEPGRQSWSKLVRMELDSGLRAAPAKRDIKKSDVCRQRLQESLG
jgi:hypothetical protein